jgi:hypothetical protein
MDATPLDGRDYFRCGLGKHLQAVIAGGPVSGVAAGACREAGRERDQRGVEPQPGPAIERGSMAPMANRNNKVTSSGASWINTGVSRRLYLARPVWM